MRNTFLYFTTTVLVSVVTALSQPRADAGSSPQIGDTSALELAVEARPYQELSWEEVFGSDPNLVEHSLDPRKSKKEPAQVAAKVAAGSTDAKIVKDAVKTATGAAQIVTDLASGDLLKGIADVIKEIFNVIGLIRDEIKKGKDVSSFYSFLVC